MADVIKVPQHYTGGDIEPKDLILAGCFPHYVASAIEYIWRHKKKNGAEDLRKAAQCLRMHAEAFERDGDYADMCGSMKCMGFYDTKHVSAFEKSAGRSFDVFDYCDMEKIQCVILKIEAYADEYESKRDANHA